MRELGQQKMERARSYILLHPDESKDQQSAGASVSVATIAAARAQLVNEGKLASTRKGNRAVPDLAPWQPSAIAASPPVPQVADAPSKTVPPRSGPRVADGLLDHAALVEMAAVMDEVSSLDDEAVLRKLALQCLGFAMNPRLHPDTRMSASQMWTKLKERQRERDLGPGVPVTFDEAVQRLGEMMVACGPKAVMAAIDKFFSAGGPDAKVVEAQPAVGTAEAAPAA